MFSVPFWVAIVLLYTIGSVVLRFIVIAIFGKGKEKKKRYDSVVGFSVVLDFLD